MFSFDHLQQGAVRLASSHQQCCCLATRFSVTQLFCLFLQCSGRWWTEGQGSPHSALCRCVQLQAATCTLAIPQAMRGSKLVKCCHCKGGLDQRQTCWRVFAVCRAPEQHSRAVTAGKAFPQLSLMVTYGHYYHVFTVESTETANPRSGPGLSADRIHLYQARQPLQMTQEHRIRGTLLSGRGALCFTVLYALHRHQSPSAALLPVLAKDSCCFLVLCWHLPTSANSQEDIFLCFLICVQYCWLLAVKGQCYSSQRQAMGYVLQNVAETRGKMNLSDSLHNKTPVSKDQVPF